MRITISDTGAGLTQEEIGKLFQSFSRATAGQRLWIEGAGLGLYVAKKFIAMHGGLVWAESDGKGKGSRFIIDLPLAAKPDESAAEEDDEPDVDEASGEPAPADRGVSASE